MALFKKPAIDYIICGLGNPGREYERTRHNAGFMAVDYISGIANAKITTLKHMSLNGKAVISGHKAVLIKPQTYMNRSGESVAAVAKFYGVAPEQIIVIYDDSALPPGTIRVRLKGSSGGHNGIKSLIEHLKTEDFPRIKIGIGDKPHPEADLADYVTSKFSPSEIILIQNNFDKIFESVCDIMNGNPDNAMRKFN